MKNGTTVILALQVAIAGVALGQDNQASTAGENQNTGIVSRDSQRVPSGTIRASKIVGMEVYNRQGKHLGEVKDVVLDSSNKRIGYAVLSYGGLAGLGDKLFAVPHKMVQHSSSDSRLYVELDEQVLRNAPGFDQSKWPSEANADYYKQLDTYYKDHGQKQADLPRHDADNVADATADRLDRDDAQPAAGQVHSGDQDIAWNRRVSSLIGANVENTNGDNLGEVKDVLIEWQSGNVRYAVLSYGGILGLGDKLFAVPISAFTTQPDSSKLVLNINKDQLKNAPGFDQNQWPNTADKQWSTSVDQFYQQNRQQPQPMP